MQDCFRKFPEIYGSELADDEDEAAAPAPEGAEALAKTEETTAQPTPKAEEVIPKKATDATEANEGKEQ